MRYSKGDIRNFLNQLDSKKAYEFESEILEFKEWISKANELYKTLTEYAVCFANQKGGTIVLGVKDKVLGKEKAITGCGGYNIHEIKSRIYEATDPKILVDIEELHLDEFGTTLLLIHVPAGIGIYTTTDGTGKIRIGKTCKPLTGTMRQQKLLELGLVDITGEVFPNLKIECFDRLEIERLKDIIRAKRPAFQLLRIGNKELLEQIGITKGNIPTFAGLLLIGREEIIQEYLPTHEVDYLLMKSDVQYHKRNTYKKCILYIIDDLYRTIEIYNKITTVKSGLFHFEIKDFPEESYREAILNAILHRDYAKTGSVFIKHYTNRIEISNPGGFIAGITPGNILRQDSKPRNKHLAEILRKLGLIEKAGMGIKRMFYTQLSSGKEPPIFFTDGNSVRVTIKDGTIDEPFVKFVREREKSGQEFGLDELLILSVLRRQREVALTEATNILQLDATRTREILMNMVRKGLLERSGIKKGLVYRLGGTVYKKLGESIAYIRERGIDEIRYREMILEYVKKYGEITNRHVRELLGVNKDKASRLLKELSQKGKLKRVGSGRKGAKYVYRGNSSF